jgi:hypothetical protein
VVVGATGVAATVVVAELAGGVVVVDEVAGTGVAAGAVVVVAGAAGAGAAGAGAASAGAVGTVPVPSLGVTVPSVGVAAAVLGGTVPGGVTSAAISLAESVSSDWVAVSASCSAGAVPVGCPDGESSVAFNWSSVDDVPPPMPNLVWLELLAVALVALAVAPGIEAPPRYWVGLRATPPTRVSKWRCGPVQLPVQPTYPIT